MESSDKRGNLQKYRPCGYGKSLGAEIVEVGDVAEALHYFTGYKPKSSTLLSQ
ncbi:MAG: hypothetical protein QXJ69_07555 [Desulfurococcaceae archaeon]